MPLVSVIMSVFNGEKYVAEAIESIQSQTLTDFEFIIVDDGSKDRLAEIIRSYEENDARIRFFQLRENQGIADARNRGLAAAQGEFITMMDCDDVSLPTRLERQVGFLRSHAEIGAVGISAKKVGPDLSQTLGIVRLQRSHSLIALDSIVGEGFVYSTIMFRRQILTDFGGYDPGRRIGVERVLVARLLWETGIRYANINEPLLLYRRHDASNSAGPDARLAAELREVFEQMISRLWNETPPATMERFARMRRGEKLTWLERRAATGDIRRLIDALVAAHWVENQDRAQLLAYMNRRLEQMTPRVWQMLCHWRRHRFGRESQ